MSEKTRAHVFISGKVQGVFFRYETKREAERVGVTGWVRNLRDGKVEAVFEGGRDTVSKMIDYCHEGPPSARVTGVKIVWEEPTGEFSDFKLKQTT